MIAKVSRGADGAGLARYLFGQGRENEHADQRVIAASVGVEVPHSVALNRDEILELGRQLDCPQAMFDVDVKDGHIWHLSLANPAGDRSLSDAEWSRIAHETMDRLGFSESAEHAGCPWVAIGHGLSTAGNEHIHVAVSLVREDGTKASIWQDRVTLSSACGEFERAYGLTIVDGRSREGLPGVSRAEDELARRRGRAEPEREMLARQVRAASVAARDEAEFVRRLRAEGVIVRPRFARGGEREVVGFSVALRPAQPGQEVTWYGGGRLAKDLALPRLREQWEHSPTAAAEWKAERSAGGREERVLAREGWSVAVDRVAEVGRHLDRLALADAPRWAAAARETAGVVSQLAVRLEERPGELAHAAQVLARSAQIDRGGLHVVRDGPVLALGDVAAVARQANGTGQDAGLLLTELAGTTERLSAHHADRGQTYQAAQVRGAAADLAAVAARWAAVSRALPNDWAMSKVIGGELDQDMTEEERMLRERMSDRDRDRGLER